MRKLDAAHMKNGYWRFTTEVDEQRAHAVGHHSPESILSAVHCGDGTYKDIHLRWIPGSIDENVVGPLSGNAAQHLQHIHEARRFLGKSLAIPGNVPLYPVDPRMKSYWETKRAAASSATSVQGMGASASPLPSSHSSRLLSPHAHFDHGRNIFGSPAPSPTIRLGSRLLMAPSESPQRTPSKPAQSHSPSLSSAPLSLSQSQHATSSQRSEPASDAAQHSYVTTEPGLSDRTKPSQTSPATAEPSRHSAHATPSSQSRDPTISPQHLNNDRNYQETHSSGPTRPDVMAGHLTAEAAPSLLTPHQSAGPSGSISSVMALEDSFSILGLSSSLVPTVAPPPSIQVAAGPQFEVPSNAPTQPQESNDIVCEDLPSVEFDEVPGTDNLPVANFVNLPSDSSATSTGLQEMIDLVKTTGSSSAVGKAKSFEQSPEADCNENNKSTSRETDDSSRILKDATIQQQPFVEDMYPDLSCMDCGREAGHHTSDCYIGSELISARLATEANVGAGLKPMKHLTMLDYRNLAEAIQRFDPGPWTTHQGPPPDPEPESAEDQIHGVAEVIRNEDSYKNDPALHSLPDDMMVLLWGLKISPNVKVVEEYVPAAILMARLANWAYSFGSDSGIGGSDSDQ